MQAEGLANAFDAIDRIERRMGMKDDAVAAVDRAAAVAKQFGDVRLFDLVAAELNLDVGVLAAQPTGAEAGPDVIDSDARHALGTLDCLAGRGLAALHVSAITATS